MRTAHTLKTNKSSRMPRNLFFVDTETIDDEPTGNRMYQALKLGACCRIRLADTKNKQTEQWHEFTDAGSLWDFIDGHVLSGRRNYVFAHLLVYDFVVADGFRHLLERGWEYKVALGRHQTLILKFRRRHTTLLLLDTLNYFRCGVDALGDMLGTPKLSIDFATCTDEELRVYNRRDVEIIRDAMLKYLGLIRTSRSGRFSPTIASQAFNSYRHGFMPVPILIHDRKCALRLERKAFRGARTECYRIGTFKRGPYYKIDVNSMYPHVMRHGLFPVRITSLGVSMAPVEMEEALRLRGAVADVDVETMEPAYGVRSDRGLIFPLGRFRVVLTGPELIHAIRHDHLRHVHYAAFYETAPAFADFVEYWTRLKTTADAQRDVFSRFVVKAVLNSLYGKFGQQTEIWTPEIPYYGGEDYYEEALDYDTGEIVVRRCLCGIGERLEGHDEAYNSFPAIAAYVTAYARLYLWRLIQQAGALHVYYVDTDSLIVDRAGFKRLESRLDDRELGKLKCQSVSETLTIRTLKDYETDTESHRKGVRKNAVEIEHNVYAQDQLPGIDTLLKLRDVHRYFVETVIKRVSGTYLKGRVTRNGHVVPFALGDGYSIDRDGRLLHV